MPNSKCAAAFCSNKREEARKRKLDIIFHSFPHDDAVRGKWIEFCRRGKQWTPYKTDAVCSVHFKKHDYQMANSPRLWSKNLRRLNHDAFPTITNGSVVTVSKKQKIYERTCAQLVEELYHHPQQNVDVSTERDHTYSGVTAAVSEELQQAVMQVAVYRLQKFPNVCACCLRAIADEKLFTPFAHYHDELECTIEQKMTEITGLSVDEADRANRSHLSPDKVCADCFEALVTFHQYQRQLQCMRKFSIGLTHLLLGNREPLAALYGEQRPYLANLLTCLNVCEGPEDNVTLERLELEVAACGLMQKSTLLELPPEGSNQPQAKAREAIPPQRDGSDKGGPKKWICPYEKICRESFPEETALQQHVRDDHKVFRCRTCGIGIKFYDLFTKYLDSHEMARALLLSHNGKESPSKEHKCGTCGKSSQSAVLLKQHGKTWCVAPNCVCDTCLGSWASVDEFNNHTCSMSRMKIEPADAREDDPETELEGRSHESIVTPLRLSSSSVELSIEILR